MKALVYKSTGSWYQLKDETGKIWNARMKGIFKIEDINSTNPIAVGDIVEVEIENEEQNIATIISIENRKNYVARASPHNKHKHHIVASNLDQSILLATLKNPKTSTGFADRYLVACEMYHIPVTIVVNKADLYKEKELMVWKEWCDTYTSAGYHLILISLEKKQGLDELESLLKDKTTLLCGHSGVGKSTFINYLFPELGLKTTEVSDWSGKGLHTTTFAEMFDLNFGGKIIDTPGIRELAMTNITKSELSGYFPEMKAKVQQCKFNNCLHINEPDCAVKAAVMKQEIAESRFVNYYNILDSIEDKNY